MAKTKIEWARLKNLPTERPLPNGKNYFVENEDGSLSLYSVTSDGNPKFIRGISEEDSLKINRLNNDEITKLEGLDTQAEIDDKIQAVDDKIGLASGSVIPITGTVLPQGAPIPSYITTTGKAELQGGSLGKTYTQTGGSPITVGAGNGRYAYYDKETDLWTPGEEYPLPQVTGTNILLDEEVPKGKAVKIFVKPLLGVMTIPNNKVDTRTFVAGVINETGSTSSTNNTIRLNYSNVPEEVKGQYVTVSGMGSVPTAAALLSVRGEGITQIASIVGAGAVDLSPKTILIPLESTTWAFTIANDASDGGIGTRPQDNPYVNSFMVNIGTEALPFDFKGDPVVDPSKIGNPDDIVFSNEITENGDGAVPAKEVFKINKKIDSVTIDSPNLVDYTTKFESGYWASTGSSTSSNNWIRVSPIYFNQETLNKLSNGESLKLTISGGGAVSSSASVISFLNSSGSVISNTPGTGANTFPVTVDIPFNAVGYRGSVANVIGIGLTPTDNIYTGTYQAEIADAPTPYQPYGDISINPEKLPKTSSYDTSEIILKKIDNDNLQIFFHIGGANDTWYRINLLHQIMPDKFTDVWRINEGYVVKRLNKDTFTTGLLIVRSGVYENAIYTSGYGYTDALGSTHGWEMLDEFGLFMDGTRIDVVSMPTDVFGAYLTFTTRTFFKAPNGVDDVGVSFKKWDFKNGLLTISNNIQWMPSTPISIDPSGRAYLGMLSIARNAGGQNVTHTTFSNEDGKFYDVSIAGFTTPIYSDSNNPRRNQIVIWGDSFKAEVRVVKKQIYRVDGTVINSLPNSGMFVQNTSSPDYNKIYPLFGSTVINSGDFWESVTEYRFSNI